MSRIHAGVMSKRRHLSSYGHYNGKVKKVKGLTFYIPALRRKPEQKRFTTRSGVRPGAGLDFKVML